VTSHGPAWDLLDEVLRDLENLGQEIDYSLREGVVPRTADEWSDAAFEATSVFDMAFEDVRRRVWLAQIERDRVAANANTRLRSAAPAT
jgi:hypothetical protein